MEGAIQKRIVNIVLPLEGENNENVYFSGFVFVDGIIITCQHGFENDVLYDNSRKIEIVSQQGLQAVIKFKGKTLADLKDEDIVHFESKAYDIVLLKSAQVKGVLYPILKEELNMKYQWEAGGYPYFNRHNRDTRGYKHFSGSCEAVESNNKHLTLTVETEGCNPSPALT